MDKERGSRAGYRAEEAPAARPLPAWETSAEQVAAAAAYDVGKKASEENQRRIKESQNEDEEKVL